MKLRIAEKNVIYNKHTDRKWVLRIYATGRSLNTRIGIYAHILHKSHFNKVCYPPNLKIVLLVFGNVNHCRNNSDSKMVLPR